MKLSKERIYGTARCFNGEGVKVFDSPGSRFEGEQPRVVIACSKNGLPVLTAAQAKRIVAALQKFISAHGPKPKAYRYRPKLHYLAAEGVSEEASFSLRVLCGLRGGHSGRTWKCATDKPLKVTCASCLHRLEARR